MLRLSLRLAAFALAVPASALLGACLAVVLFGGTDLLGGPLELTICIGVSVLAGIGAAIWTARLRQRQRREWLRVILHRIDAAIIMTDRRGAVTSMNGAAESLTGWREAEAIGLPVVAVFRLIDLQTRRPVVNPVVKALYQGIAVGPSDETTLIGKDGVERQISEAAAPILDDRGRAFGCALAFRDLTGRIPIDRPVAVETAAS